MCEDAKNGKIKVALQVYLLIAGGARPAASLILVHRSVSSLRSTPLQLLSASDKILGDGRVLRCNIGLDTIPEMSGPIAGETPVSPQSGVG